MISSRRLILPIAVAFALVGAACGSDSKSASTTTAATSVPATTAAPATAAAPATTAATATTAAAVTTTVAATTPAASGTITVFAASSLTEAFTAAGKAFEAANPGSKVVFNFAGSGDLVTQIGQGAPADVFASADDTNMKKLSDAGEAVGTPVHFASNTLEIITEKGNPKGIATLADLAKPDTIVVLCAATQPCGKLAKQILDKASVTVTPKSLEDKVKGVVTKVTAGEADAGIVFVTDVKAAGDAAAGVEIPSDQNVVTEYPASVTKEATNPNGGAAFIAFVAGPAGQSILASSGFQAP